MWKELLEKARNSWLSKGFEFDSVVIESVSPDGKKITLENLGEYILEIIDGDEAPYLLVFCPEEPQSHDDIIHVVLEKDGSSNAKYKP